MVAHTDVAHHHASIRVLRRAGFGNGHHGVQRVAEINRPSRCQSHAQESDSDTGEGECLYHQPFRQAIGQGRWNGPTFVGGEVVRRVQEKRFGKTGPCDELDKSLSVTVRLPVRKDNPTGRSSLLRPRCKCGTCSLGGTACESFIEFTSVLEGFEMIAEYL